MKVPYKNQLSNSSRAIAQRNRAALRNKEEKAISNAKASNHAAKYQLKKKLQAEQTYITASEAEKKAMLAAAEEKVAEKRFNAYSSGWLLQPIITYLH